MSDKMRWRYGETNPIIVPVGTGLIEIGDIMYWDGTVARPATDHVSSGVLTDQQSAIASKFVGVAMQRSPEGDTAPIRVATSGVFEMNCDSATFEIGKLIGAAPEGTKFSNQKIAAVTSALGALGRIAKREPVVTPCVLVALVSTFMSGGIRGTTYNPT